MAIVFEEKAVAFIDVLGFKELVKEAAHDDNLQKLEVLVETLDSSMPSLDSTVSPSVPKELIPKHIYISDCIILSAPLKVNHPDWNFYDGLNIVIMRAIQLSHILYHTGYLVRGGISIGKVWHGDSNIVGPAYQESYQLELCARMPRIILSDNAEAHWKANCQMNRMCIDYDNRFMVNTLFDYYIPGDQPNKVQNAFKLYFAMANTMASDSGLSDGVREKWMWFRDYVQAEMPAAIKWDIPSEKPANTFI